MKMVKRKVVANVASEYADETYKSLLDLLVELGSDQIIENKDERHCRTLILTLLEKVTPQNYIGLFTGLMDASIYDNLIVTAIKKHLDQKVPFKLLFQNEPSNDFKDTVFYKTVLSNKQYTELIDIRILKSTFSTYDQHILTISDKACRLEVDHAQKRAYASFFNNGLGKKIRESFEKLFSDDFSYSLPASYAS